MRYRYKLPANVLWIILILLLWEILSLFNVIPIFILPPPSRILRAFFREYWKKQLGKVVFNSIKTVFTGYCASLILAVFIASFCLKSTIISSLFTTLHGVFNPLPSVAILPVVILLTGLTHFSIILLIFHAVFWPSFYTILTSFQSMPKSLIDFSKNLELSPLESLLFIRLPAIFPYLLTSMRSSWGRSWRALISAEAIFGLSSGSSQGLGFYIYSNRAYANMTNVLVGVLSIIIISILIESIFNFIEEHTIEKWEIKND